MLWKSTVSRLHFGINLVIVHKPPSGDARASVPVCSGLGLGWGGFSWMLLTTRTHGG